MAQQALEVLHVLAQLQLPHNDAGQALLPLPLAHRQLTSPRCLPHLAQASLLCLKHSGRIFALFAAVQAVLAQLQLPHNEAWQALLPLSLAHRQLISPRCLPHLAQASILCLKCMLHKLSRRCCMCWPCCSCPTTMLVRPCYHCRLHTISLPAPDACRTWLRQASLCQKRREHTMCCAGGAVLAGLAAAFAQQGWAGPAAAAGGVS